MSLNKLFGEFSQKFRFVLVIVLTFELSGVSSLAQSNLFQTNDKQVGSGLISQQDFEERQLILRLMQMASMHQSAMQDPIQQVLLHEPFRLKNLYLDKTLIDRNPFWMLGQQWSEVQTFEGVSESNVQYRTDDDLTTFVFRELGKSLSIPHGFTILGTSNDKVLMTDAEEDGLWFIDLNEAADRSSMKASVPVYFFPLPKSIFPILSVVEEVSANWTIIEFGEDESITLDDKLFSKAMAWQNHVLTLSISQCMRNPICRRPQGRLSTDPEKANGQIMRLLPTVGTVGGHGFIPGLDPSRQGLAQSNFPSRLETIARFLIPQVHAISLDPAVIARAIHVASVMGVVMGASLFLQMTFLREKLAQLNVIRDIETRTGRLEKEILTLKEKLLKHRDRISEAELKQKVTYFMALDAFRRDWSEANSNLEKDKRTEVLNRISKSFEEMRVGTFGEVPKLYESFWKRRRTNFVNTWDIFAHGMTVLFQFSEMTMASSVEFFADRFLPGVASGENSITRLFINKTFIFASHSVKDGGASARTFWLGAIVAGVTDSSIVGGQYEFMFPAMAEWASESLSPETRSLVLQAFDTSRPDAAMLMINDVTRNQIAYLVAGSVHFSSDARAIELQTVEKAVEKELRSRGLNPYASENKELRDKLILEEIDRALARLGVPTANQFLFDFGTYWRGVQNWLGYGMLTSNERKRSQIVERPGLSIPALKLAIEVAKSVQERNNEKENLGALRALESVQSAFSLVDKIRGKGKFPSLSARQTAQRARATLALLALEGPADRAAQLFPELWSGFSPEEYRRANVMFRFAVASIGLGRGEVELHDDFTIHDSKKREVKAEQRKQKQEKLDFYAKRQLQQAEAAGFQALAAAVVNSESPELRTAHAEHVEAFEAIVRKSIARRYSVQTQQGLVMDGVLNKVGISVMVQAETEALRVLGQQLINIPRIRNIHPELELAYRSGFDRGLAKSVGLTYSEGDHIKYAESRADAAVVIAEKSSEALALQDEEYAYQKTLLLARVHSLEFLRAYREATQKSAKISAMHPDQPGTLQFVRQWSLVKSSKALTTAVRILEGTFADGRFVDLGFSSLIDRTIPGWYDMVGGTAQMMRRLPSMMTSRYLTATYFWLVPWAYPVWALFSLSIGLIITPTRILQRVFRNIGYKPLNNTISKLTYMIPYSMVTWTPSIVLLLFQNDARRVIPDFYGPALTAGAGIGLSLISYQAYLKFIAKNPALDIKSANPHPDDPLRTTSNRIPPSLQCSRLKFNLLSPRK